MFQHNLTLIVRNFKRAKGAFFINLIGLSTGLACAMLIFLWVQDEWSFDKFHAQGDQLYRVMANHIHTDVTNTQPDVPGLLAPALKAEFPEVEKAVSTSSGGVKGSEILTISTENQHFKTPGRFASQDFFNVFSYDLIEGNKDQVLADKNGIVLCESLARKLFGTTENVIGKTLDWEAQGFKAKVSVSGVFRDVPANSSEVFEFVLPFDYFEQDLIGKYAHWRNYYAYAYLLLKKGAVISAFNAKIKDFVEKRAEGSNITLFVEPFAENYLHGKYVNGVQAGGRIEYLRLFSIIALFILAIACINFMNLSTAKSARRGKEVGVKKAIGASRSLLIRQFMGESLLMAFGSLVVAMVLVALLLPQFNQITGKALALRFDANLLVPMLGITLLTGLIAGSYPALYLSNFNPLSILKGKIKASVGELWVRKGLVVFQFGISLVMIVGVMIIYTQIKFVQNKNLGFNKDNVVNFELEGKANENRTAFFTELRKIPGVVGASSTGFQMGKGGWTQGVEWEGKAPDADFTFHEVYADEGALEVLGMQVKEGRSFSKQFGTDDTGIIFNEAAIKTMGLKDPVGKKIHHYTGDKQIVGVVQDFNFNSLQMAIKPLFFLYNPEKTTRAVVKIAAGNERETMGRITDFYASFNPGYTLAYTFMDQDYQAMYDSEQRVSMLSRYFAILAILISCLGLFGLATYTAEQRSKEIGIRKVLGASVAGITGLLAKDFLKLVVIAVVIASPVAWYFMSKWLADFAYRIDIQWWMFVAAGLVAMLIAFLTVSFQSVRAALANPVESLRNE